MKSVTVIVLSLVLMLFALGLQDGPEPVSSVPCPEGQLCITEDADPFSHEHCPAGRLCSVL